jgi:hypothetical protein
VSRFIRILALVVVIVIMGLQLHAEDPSPLRSLAEAQVWQPSRNVFSEYRVFFDYPSLATSSTKFWKHNYISGELVTHTGFDYNLDENAAHVYVPWNAFGKVQETISYPASLNKASIITVRQLLQNGDYLYCKGLHFYAGSIRVEQLDYVAQGHLVAREGNTGVNSAYAGDESNTHLHYECGNLGSTPWVPSTLTCPDSALDGETEYCTPDDFGRAVLRDTSHDIDGLLLAHYSKSNSGKVWYPPQEVIRQYSELIPCLSRSSAAACATSVGGYDVYGVANMPLYGQLNARGAFDEVGIVARVGDSIRRADAETASFSTALGVERKWLALETGATNLDGLIGQRTDYGLGDYLFLASVLKGERRYGFPLRISFVAEGDFIVDNDKPLDGGASYEDNLEPLASRPPLLSSPANPDLPKIYPYYNDLVNRVPGYFMTGSLVRGRSGAFARWRVGQTGFVRISVFVPRGATATSVQYKIVDSYGNVTLSAPIDQAANQERWVELSDEASVAFFDLSAGGYLGIYLPAEPGGEADQHNYLSVGPADQVGFDAVKFEHGGSSCRAMAGCSSLTAVNVSGPSSVNENGTGAYTATANFSDGSSSTVTAGATWSENSSATTISAGGILSAGSVSSNQSVTVTATYTSGGVTRSGTKILTIVDVPKTLSSVSVSGPSSVNEMATGAYTATAIFSDGSSSSVTTSVIWSESSSFTTISAAGVLSASSVASNQSVTVTATYTHSGVTRSGTKAVTIVDVPKTLSSVSVSGPSSVNENKTGAYTATAIFSDGSSSSVTTIWGENSSATTISAGGVLSAGSVTSNQSVTVTATYTYSGVTRSGTKAVTIVDVPKTLSSVNLSGPSSVNEKTTGFYTATATFSDGSSSTVTPSSIWGENSSATTISSAGVLSAGSVSSNQSVTVTATYTYGGITKSGTKVVTVVNVLTYTSSPAPGTYTSSGNVLKIKATFVGSTVTFTVAKQDGSAFTTGGTMTIRAGASYGCVANNNTYYWNFSSGRTTTSASFNLSQYFTSGSKDLYAAIGRPGTYCDGTRPAYYSGRLTITAQ